MKQIWRFCKSCAPLPPILFLLLINLMFSGVSLVTPEVLRLATEAIEKMSLEAFIPVIWLAVLVTIASVVLEYIMRLTECRLQNSCESSLQEKILDKTFCFKKLHFMALGTGEVVTKLTQNIPSAVQGTLSFLTGLVSGSAGIILGILYMTFLNPTLMLCMLTFNLLFRFFTRFYDKKIRSTAKKIIAINSRNSAFILDILNSTVIVKLFGRFEFFQSKFQKNEKELLGNELKAFALQNSYDELLWMTKKVAEIAILYGFGGYLITRGETNFSAVIAFTLANDYFSKGISALISAINEKNKVLPYIETITQYLQHSEVESETGTLEQKEAYAIKFDDVSFGYGDTEVLHNVSFTIAPGEKIMLAGPNGQGKSTLLGLLLGFYRPSHGHIYYGDRDIGSISLRSLSQQYAYIPQNSHIFDDTLCSNLLLGRPDDGLAGRLLEQLHLTQTSEQRAISLSQGEKQRVGIGRAIDKIRHCAILAGDEIFSNIDKENQQLILPVIEELTRGKTVILVCHEDIGFAFDRVLYVQEGTVKEGGRYAG